MKVLIPVAAAFLLFSCSAFAQRDSAFDHPNACGKGRYHSRADALTCASFSQPTQSAMLSSRLESQP
jgi:hypothetical protein